MDRAARTICSWATPSSTSEAALTPAAEVPPTDSKGSGALTASYDTATSFKKAQAEQVAKGKKAKKSAKKA